MRTIRVPGDKSISHRALLFATLATGESRLEGVLPGADCQSTANALRAMGVSVPELPLDGSPFSLRSAGMSALRAPSTPLDCGNSGTTARLLLGLLTGLGVEASLTGDESLRSRPMARVTSPLEIFGAQFREEGEPGRLPLRTLGGRIGPIRHRSAVASAQVKSALLLAGLGQGVRVEVEEPQQSRDHTERMLRRMGVAVQARGVSPHSVVLPEGSWAPSPIELQVPGDVSSAAFFLVLSLLGGAGPGLTVANVGLNPTRTGLLDVLERMGAGIVRTNLREEADEAGEPAGDLTAQPGRLSAVEVGGDEIPALIDEVPILAVAAARAEGTTVIRDAAELRVKESDRIRALALNFSALGVEVEELEDGLVIHGSDRLLVGRVRAFHDHRIAMAFGVLGALPGNRIQVEDPEVASVSFPGFWDLLDELGGGAGSPSGGTGDAGAPSGPALGDSAGRIITIDGPAGSGKSSTASDLARHLGFRHLDSGAIYRALTLALIRKGIPAEDWEARAVPALEDVRVELAPNREGFQVLLDGEGVGDAIRSHEVTEGVPVLAAIPGVREKVIGVQRDAAVACDIVAEGRDMGTVVFPSADLKVYLTAELPERATRRILQLGEEPTPEAVQTTAAELAERDRQDEGRTAAPLRKPEGALEVDTTSLTRAEQVRVIADAMREVGTRTD
ncbi:MAG: 3-phosphoshikimate 1-carboxyvinyltransferase [Gemmatimonadota bacterium]